jgi:signal transduction histidine kinase
MASECQKSTLAEFLKGFIESTKVALREKGGTGLGLSIVKHIIEAHQAMYV